MVIYRIHLTATWNHAAWKYRVLDSAGLVESGEWCELSSGIELPLTATDGEKAVAVVALALGFGETIDQSEVRCSQGFAQATTMDIPEKITVRLGSLRKSLQAACERSGRTPSEEVRQRLAKSLKVKAPKLVPGNPTFRKRSD